MDFKTLMQGLKDAEKLITIRDQAFLVAPLRRRAAEAAREDIAKKVFNRQKVANLMGDAALRGEMYVQLAQEHPVDLSGTKVARALLRKLTAAGYSLRWAPAQKECGIFGRKPLLYVELEISWESYQRQLATEETNAAEGDQAGWSDGTPMAG